MDGMVVTNWRVRRAYADAREVPTSARKAALRPGDVSASTFILDTGTPPNPPPADVILNAADWYAAEFSYTSGETITQLQATLTSLFPSWRSEHQDSGQYSLAARPWSASPWLR